jgi:Holliday junction resolvase-like predicted endonuclease
VIVFVEIKVCADHEFGHPFNALMPAKQRKIIQTA